MNISQLFRKIMLEAAKSSLDAAGSALLPGIWPFAKGALNPILEHINERLGDGEATDSVENAELAAQIFENDRHLQEMLRSRLLPALDQLAKGQEKMSGDIQAIMAIVSDDKAALAEISTKIDSGIALDDATISRLADEISRRTTASRHIRAIAVRELGAASTLASRQVGRLQARAVELIDEKQFDRAMDELNEGAALVAALLAEAPTDLNLQMQLGMIYKTLAQVYKATDQADAFRKEVLKAQEVFRYVLEDVPDDQKSRLNIANAVHGLANMTQITGDIDAAIQLYREALKLDEDHYYAWHDLFACLFEKLKAGENTLAEMRKALDMVEKTGTGKPGLGAQHIAKLEEIYSWSAQRFEAN